MRGVNTILLDLDGTLVDTAPDLVHALNRLRAANALPPMPLAAVRPQVSHGAKAMLELGFAGADDGRLAHLHEAFLALYAEDLVRESAPFPGMVDVLDGIERAGMRWGVVTNKPGWLTEPLLEALGLHARAACVVNGDTLAERKPHPAPLLHACRLAGSDPASAVYIGDSRGDIDAGRRGGLRTAVAMFGYLGDDDSPEDWGADALLSTPGAILDWLSIGAVRA